MVKVTMDQIIAFRNNGDFFADTTLPLKGAYKLNKIKKAVEKEGEKYAKHDDEGQLVFSEDGNQIMIKDGMVEECNKALEDLQNLEVEIETYGFNLDDLGEDAECTPDELEALMPFME